MDTTMILNPEQKSAVANCQPVALNVSGTECVIVRRDVYLRMDPDFDTGRWSVEEMNLLSDEADAIICRREANEG
jgi:hypothetical protein